MKGGIIITTEIVTELRSIKGWAVRGGIYNPMSVRGSQVWRGGSLLSLAAYPHACTHEGARLRKTAGRYQGTD